MEEYISQCIHKSNNYEVHSKYLMVCTSIIPRKLKIKNWVLCWSFKFDAPSRNRSSDVSKILYTQI